MLSRCLLDNSFSSDDRAFKILAKLPFDFALYPDLNLRGRDSALPYIYSKTNWRCIIRTTSGKNIPVTVIPNRIGEHTYLIVKVFSDYSTSEERELKKRITQVFSLKLDLLPFYRKAKEDARFFAVIRKLKGLRPYFSQDPFEALVKTVIRQVIRADMARNAVEVLVLRFGTKRIVGGKDFYGFPSAETLSKATKNELIQCKVGFKWKLIKKLSYDVVSGDLDLYELARFGNEKVVQRLTEYRGIGYWTSGIFLYDGLKRLDTYPIYDISLRKAISLIYFRGKPISWKEVESFFADYRDFRGIAANYLFGALWLQRWSDPSRCKINIGKTMAGRHNDIRISNKVSRFIGDKS